MRKIEYLSPTSISLFYQSTEEFYTTYLTDNKVPRMPQTEPMAVGSAFDAYVKAYLHEKIYGKGFDPKFDLTALFEAQVAPEHRDFGRRAGTHVFEEYQKSGSLADLLSELEGSVGNPRFESELRGVVSGYREGVTLDIQGMTLLGKPDVYFINKFGGHVILDWKVNGYCSNYPTSPMKGYIKVKSIDKFYSPPHKDAFLITHKGMTINGNCFLEQLNQDWARQLSIYAWLCGEEVGHSFIAAIDQVVCNPDMMKPKLRFAQHRLRVSEDFQFQILRDAQHVWEVCYSAHIFRNLSLTDSVTKCEMLDKMAGAYNPQEDVFNQLTRDR